MARRPTPIARTKRLVLRPLGPGDYAVWRAANLERPEPKNEWERPKKPATEFTRAKFRALVRDLDRRIAKDQFYDLAIFRRADGALLGGVAIMDVWRGLNESAYLGYSLFNSHWGRGYAKEAVRAAFGIAFRKLKLHRIEAGIEPRNRRSIRLARSLGMRKEGCKRRVLFLRGKWRDMMIYSVTCEDLGWKFLGRKPIHPSYVTARATKRRRPAGRARR